MQAQASNVTGSEPSGEVHATTLPYEEVEPTVFAWLENLKQSRPNWYPFVQKVQEILEPGLFGLLKERDGAAMLSRELPKTYSPEEVAKPGSAEQRGWELAGLFYKNQGRYHEALPIFAGLYEHILVAQEQEQQRFHKGMPLVWISDCYRDMGFPVLGKRYLMLAMCEDAIRDKGTIDAKKTGVYFRLIWHQGLPDSELHRYAEKTYELWKTEPVNCRYPEWILQELGHNWMTEVPSAAEGLVYAANMHYIKHLLSRLGDSSGETLERLADYVLSCMPGCRTRRRQRSASTDYDIVCSMDGFDVDFRSEFGRYFVCECKDWNIPAEFATLAKFCRVLDSTKSRFGILFSKSGLSGYGKTADAEREQLKVFQDRGMVIVVVDRGDLDTVAEGTSFIGLLRSKYERVRLDLTHSGGSVADIRSSDAVRTALKECDQLGRDAFLRKYGFGRARKHFLEYAGKLYDPMATLAAAYRFEYPERGPLGNTATSNIDAVRLKLECLGFQVVEKS